MLCRRVLKGGGWVGQGERREESAECDTERVRGCFMLFVLRIYGMDYGRGCILSRQHMQKGCGAVGLFSIINYFRKKNGCLEGGGEDLKRRTTLEDRKISHSSSCTSSEGHDVGQYSSVS